MKPAIATLIMLITLSAFSQPEKRNRHHDKHRPEFTMDQKKSLRLKQLTLALDLSSSQQKEMALLINSQLDTKKAMREEMKAKVASGEKPTSEEMYQHKSKILDQRIAYNERAKKILDKNQYDTWKKLQHKPINGGHDKQKRRRHLKSQSE